MKTNRKKQIHVCQHTEFGKPACKYCSNINARLPGFLARLLLPDGRKPVVEEWQKNLREAYRKIEMLRAGRSSTIVLEV